MCKTIYFSNVNYSKLSKLYGIVFFPKKWLLNLDVIIKYGSTTERQISEYN